MNKKTLLAAVLATSAFILFGLHQKNFSVIPIWKVPKLMTSMRAKEFCSCRFMLGNPTDYCLDRVKKGYPLFRYELDEEKKEVIFSNYLSSSAAGVAKNSRLGCSLR